MQKLLSILMIVSLVFTSCKKGEDDPLFSLYSRKARVCGDWTLSEASITWDIMNNTKGEHFDGNYKLEGTNLVGTESTLYTIGRVSSIFLLSAKFEKDGSFIMKETIGNSILEAKGNWNFNGGVGEDKKKEALIVQIEEVQTGSTGAHFFNQFGTNFTYKIKELRNKKMVLKVSTRTYINTQGAVESLTAEYTFTQ